MGTPRKYKPILENALETDRHLGLSELKVPIRNIISDKGVFPRIPPSDKAALFNLWAKIEVYTNADLEKANSILKDSLKIQEKFISTLRKDRYILYNPRRKKQTKKERLLSQQILEAKIELCKTQLFRAEIILLEGEPGSINHCRNILAQVLNSLIAEFGLELEKKQKKEKSKEYFRKYIEICKGRILNPTENPWEYQYVFANWLYIYSLTYRYGRVSEEDANTFDFLLKEFQNCVASINSITKLPSPKWIDELVHHTWVWQMVQKSRRGQYVEAAKEFLEFQRHTPYNSVFVRAMVQYCFIQAFKLGNLESANSHLNRLSYYDMMPDMAFIWYLTKVYCQKMLGLQSDLDYQSNVINLNRLYKISGTLQKAVFKNEIELIKNIKPLA